MTVIWIRHVTDMIRLNSSSDNSHTMTLEEVMDGDSSVVKNTVYTECHRRNGPNFGRVFLMLNYTDITQNTYVQS